MGYGSAVAVMSVGTEVWFRNPYNYVREVVEVGHNLVAMDRGAAIRRRIDPVTWASIFFPPAINFRLLLVGDQGSAEYRRGDTLERPTAVYSTWDYQRESFDVLEDLVNFPAGEDEAACSDTGVPGDERPVFGQENRVVAINLPPGSTGAGRRVLRELAELQSDYPEAIVHVHGLYGFKTAFSLGFGAVDLEVRTSAQKGKVLLPNGKEMRYEQVGQWPSWLKLMGVTPGDMEIARNRCMFNIRSALWASGHYREDVNFRVIKKEGLEPDTTSKRPAVVSTRNRLTKTSSKTQNGDKFLCDMCSLATTCKYYRAEAVCSVPDSEPSDLARLFRTRDSGQIIDGLGKVLSKQAERMERGIKVEEAEEELDPEVTKIANSIMTNAAKLAKLVDPALNGGPKFGVFINGQGGVGPAATPKAMVGSIIAELESRGIPRDKITDEMVLNLLAGGVVDRPAIEGTVVSERAG